MTSDTIAAGSRPWHEDGRPQVGQCGVVQSRSMVVRTSTARPSSREASRPRGHGCATRRTRRGPELLHRLAGGGVEAEPAALAGDRIGAKLVELVEMVRTWSRAPAGRREASPATGRGPAPRRRRRCAPGPRTPAGWRSRHTHRSPPHAQRAPRGSTRGPGGAPTRRAARSRRHGRSRPATRWPSSTSSVACQSGTFCTSVLYTSDR